MNLNRLKNFVFYTELGSANGPGGEKIKKKDSVEWGVSESIIWILRVFKLICKYKFFSWNEFD